QGLIKEAIHCYVTAIRLMPKFAAVHSNLGSVLKEQGKLDQALAHYHEALSIDPMFADAYSNMGNAYKDLGRLPDAIKCYSAAISIKPGFADAYSNLASAYKVRSAHDRNNLKIRGKILPPPSSYPPPLVDLSQPMLLHALHSGEFGAWWEGGEIVQAISCYKKALELRPDFPDAFANYVHSLVLVCDWHNRDAEFATLSRVLEAQVKRTE
ncbi:unnamed protein product, partial [Discosporangium mesarthrocarpum]